MKISTIFAALLMSSLYIICPILLRIFLYKKKFNKILALVLFGLFMIPLIIGVFANVSVSKENVIINFETNGLWASESINLNIFKLSVFDICINTVMLIPIGVVTTLFYYYKNEKFCFGRLMLRLLIMGLISGFLIELLQFILPIERSIQLSDVILNTISCTLGGIYFTLLLKIKKL